MNSQYGNERNGRARGTPHCSLTARRAVTVLIWLSISLAAISCDEGESTDTVRGRVLGAETLAPIESAWVNDFDSTDGASYSDINGEFKFSRIGKIRALYAGKLGYVTRFVDLPEGSAERQNIIVELESR